MRLHESVLLNESIDLLSIKEDGIYVDGTLGRAGHTSAILEKLTTGHLYAFDLDQQAIEYAQAHLANRSQNVTLIHAGFGEMKEKLAKKQVSSVDGILLDLGVSSPQFDDGQRGFSYRFDAKLDMRMNQAQAFSAYDLVNTYDEQELERILREYGEQPYSRQIAHAIVKHRPVRTTFELVDIVKSVLPRQLLMKKGHPAKRVFQALRIEVNGELTQLKEVLQQGIELLRPKGRMAVITFHSLEDRLVKQAFAQVAKPPKTNRRLPQIEPVQLAYRLVPTKPIQASEEEKNHNNRAHSAKLRGIERIG